MPAKNSSANWQVWKNLKKKRKIIGKGFIDVFDEEAHKIKDVKWLAQGTIYPDCIESLSITYIPNSAEVSAAKEVAANLGQNLGTSISITNQSAGDQLLSELGKGAIQGVSQYVSKKLREEKVHLKSGYTLMLSQKKNN